MEGRTKPTVSINVSIGEDDLNIEFEGPLEDAGAFLDAAKAAVKREEDRWKPSLARERAESLVLSHKPRGSCDRPS